MLQRPDVGVRSMHGKGKEGKDTRHLPLFLPYCLEAGSLSEFEVHLLARLTTNTPLLGYLSPWLLYRYGDSSSGRSSQLKSTHLLSRLPASFQFFSADQFSEHQQKLECQDFLPLEFLTLETN